MPFDIVEWFGYPIDDRSRAARTARAQEHCTFINGRCTKKFNDGSISGVCAVMVGTEASPVIICPNRLYGNNYLILSDVAEVAFGTGHRIIHPSEYRNVEHSGRHVVAFGHHFGREIRLPSRGHGGSYFVDWVLARISAQGELIDFVAVEVQAIDTTGTYRPEVLEFRSGATSVSRSRAGLNWENVNKRILPQLIYKGHVLRGEPLCSKGLFFVCPGAVYERVMTRLGNSLRPYTNLQPGSITFVWYDLAEAHTGIMPIRKQGEFSTTVDQVALYFSAPANLPPQGVFERAIKGALQNL